MVEHGATPSISAAEAKEMGFKMIIYPFAAIGPALTAIREGMEKLTDYPSDLESLTISA